MMPTKFMTTAVAMFADAFPEFLYFGDKLFTCHLFKVGVHSIVPAQQTSSAVNSSRLDDPAANYKSYGQAPLVTRPYTYFIQPPAAFIAEIDCYPDHSPYTTPLNLLQSVLLTSGEALRIICIANDIFLDRNIPNMAYSKS